jgi:hypothetical protein
VLASVEIMTDTTSTVSPTSRPGEGDAAFAAPLPLQAPSAKRPVSIPAVIALVLAAVTAIGFMSVKVLVVALDATFNATTLGIATVFGVLGLLSIILIAATIVLGHLALRKSTVHYRGRILAAVALGVGYLFLALYLNRIIVSVIAIAVAPSSGTFLQDNYYWL